MKTFQSVWVLREIAWVAGIMASMLGRRTCGLEESYGAWMEHGEGTING